MYALETCDASDAPAEREYVAIGQYARAADAIAAAQALIEAHLSLALSARQSAADAYATWCHGGEIPRITARAGAAPIQFDPFAFAKDRAQALYRRT
jgi:hypothetical protein